MGGRGASSNLQKNTSAVAPEKWRSTIEAGENRIRGRRTETAILVGMEGNILLDKSDGHESMVSFDDREVAMMDGAILTHNHPGDSTFSEKDIQILARGLSEIRAVTKYGTYVMKKAKPDADTKFGDAYETAKLNFLEHTNKVWGEALMRRANALEMDLLAEKLNRSVGVFRRQWLAKNAKNYGFIYTYERRTA